MKYLPKIASIALISCMALCPARAADGSASAVKIREVLDRCVKQQHRAPGIVAGIVDKNGVTIVSSGVCEDGKPGEVDGNTLFEIGSITKVFTGLLLQDMADHGEVQLDDPISKYLPASVTVPSRNGHEITLRSLATHSSGLPRLPKNLSPSDGGNPYADYTVAQMYEFLSSYKLKRDVGAKSEYSNFGMGLLGHILALRAGTNYEALLVKRICGPLKLDSTRITLGPELQARFATGHDENGMRTSGWDLPTLAGAGAIRSTATDLLKLLSAEMGLTPSPLANAMVKTQTPQGTKGFLREIGLAWQIEPSSGMVWHNGGTGGYRSYMGFNRDRTLGVVVLGNSANDIDDIGEYFLGARDDIDDFKAQKRRAVAAIDYQIYDHYVGKYKCSWAPDAFFTITRKGDRLLAQLTGQPFFEVYPSSETNFFYTVVEAQLTFFTNPTGAVSHLVLHQNGANLKANKIN
jgi:CubicO group peptidase (beta-lactamase class C family)